AGIFGWYALTHQQLQSLAVGGFGLVEVLELTLDHSMIVNRPRRQQRIPHALEERGRLEVAAVGLLEATGLPVDQRLSLEQLTVDERIVIELRNCEQRPHTTKRGLELVATA